MNILIAVAAFFSMIIGRYLRRLAKDEMKIGEKYFLLLDRILLLLISLMLILFSSGNWLILLTFFLGLFIGQMFKQKWFYLGLGLASSAFISVEATILMASLIFLYGLIKGTLHDNISKKLVFFIPLLLLLANNFMAEYGFLASGLAAGALFLRE